MTTKSSPTTRWVRYGLATALSTGLLMSPLSTQSGHAAPDEDAPIEVVVNGDDIAADSDEGLTFKGFGVLTANSTSAVLLDYKAQHPEEYARLLRILFGGDNPIMNHVKIEMGNDRNNSTGPDPATMRTADEEANVRRHPGFQLAADAKRLNPDLKVSILRWNAPGWVEDNDDIYTWYKNTILAAHREYGYMIDYVNPGVNEHTADLEWTKEFSERVRTDSTGYVSDDRRLAGFRKGERKQFNQIETVISDEVSVGTFGDEMIDDEELREAVGASGYHYNTNDDGAGNFTALAEEHNEQIWNSEAQATFSNTSFRRYNNTADPTTEGTGIGGNGSALEMANTIVKGFVNSRRSHFIYQPAIGSFYEGGQYSYKELVSARDPWSGWMHYDGGLAVLQHFSSFADTGWEDGRGRDEIWRMIPQASASSAQGTNPVNGRNGGPNYVTMADPAKSDFSTVIVNDSEQAQTYRITPQNLRLGRNPELSVWQTTAAAQDEQFDANFKQHVADVRPDDQGAYEVEVAPYSVVSVTSLDVERDEAWTTALPVEGERTVLGEDDEVLFSDDYDYRRKKVATIDHRGKVSRRTESFIDSRGGEEGAIPLYTWARNGAFEAHRADDGEWVLRQQLDTAEGIGGAWNGGDPVAAVGDRRWTDYRASVDVRFETESTENNYAALGARNSGGGSSHKISGTPYTIQLSATGDWTFARLGETIAEGSIEDWQADPEDWHELQLEVAGNRVTASIDDQQLVEHTDDQPYLSGWVDLASGPHHTQFDNLQVERIDDQAAHYDRYLDDLEMAELDDPGEELLRYDGEWSHANGESMYTYGRTASVTEEAGSGLEYTFDGTGLDLLGANDGSARLRVSVDGEVVEQEASTVTSGEYQQTYSLRDLEPGRHTVRIELLSGSLKVDAVGTVGAR